MGDLATLSLMKTSIKSKIKRCGFTTTPNSTMVHIHSQIIRPNFKMTHQSNEIIETNPHHYLKFKNFHFKNSTSESQKNIIPLYIPTFLKNPCGSRCQNFKITPISTPRFLEILCGSPPRKSKNLCGILSEFLKNLYVVDRPNFVFFVRPLFSLLYHKTEQNATEENKKNKNIYSFCDPLSILYIIIYRIKDKINKKYYCFL